MTTKTKYRILAVIICIVIYVIYLAIAMSLGWKHGGGVLILAILFGVISWVWKTAGEMADKADAQKKVENQERLLDDLGAEPELEPTSNEEEILPEQPVEPSGDMNPEEAVQVTPHTITSAIQLELNGILKALFLLWMVVAGIQSIVQFVSNIEGSYAIGAFDLAFTFLGITGIAGMYVKKRWGLFVAGIFFVLQLIFCLIIGETDSAFYEEAFKVVIRVIVICGLLFIRKDGHSAWDTIWNNGVITPAVISAEDSSEEKNENDNLPPIPEDDVEEINLDRLVVDVKQSIVEEPISPRDVVVDKPIEKENNNKTGHFRKYKWYYLALIFVVSLSSGLGWLFIDMRKRAIEEKECFEQRAKFANLVSEACVAYDNSLYELALKKLKEAAQIDSMHPGLYYKMGRCEQKAYEEYYSGATYYQKAYDLSVDKKDTTLNGDTITFRNILAHHAQANQNIALAQEFLSTFPDDRRAYRCMVMSYCRNYASDRDNRNAILWGKRMVEKFPTHHDSYFCLAYAYAQSEKYDTAIGYYQKCINLNPDASIAYNNMGNCYYILRNYAQAKRCYKKAIELGEYSYAPDNLKNCK